MAENEDLTIVVGADASPLAKEVAQATESGMTEGAKKGSRQTLKEFERLVQEAKKKGGLWFQDIEMPKEAKKLEAFKKALQFNEKELKILGTPKRSKDYQQLYGQIKIFEEQQRMLKTVEDRLDVAFRESEKRKTENTKKKKNIATEEAKGERAVVEEQAKTEGQRTRRAERKADNAEEEAKRALERAQLAIDVAKDQESVKEILNNGRNEMAMKEYAELVKQYQQLEKMGNRKGGEEKVRAAYEGFKEVKHGKDPVISERFSTAMMRLQSLEKIVPASIIEKITTKLWERQSAKLNNKYEKTHDAGSVMQGIANRVVAKNAEGNWKWTESAKAKLQALGEEYGKLHQKFDLHQTAEKIKVYVDSAVAKIKQLKSETDDLGKKSDESGKKTEKSAKKSESAFKKLLKAVGKVGKGLLFLTTRFTGVDKLANGLKRFATMFSRTFRYRIIRQLATKVINLIKEGFSNIDKYSKHFGTPLHDNIMRLKASLQYLKNAFAAMAAPLINYVTPALEKFMDTLASVANHIGAFFAAITGQDQFSAALKTTVKEAESTKKKLRDILGFDEINRLSGDTGEEDDAYRMFEEWDPNSQNFFARLKEALGEGDWAGLGKMLADNLNEIVAGFDAEGLGTKLGTKIQNAVTFSLSFLQNLDTTQMGNKIGEFFNKLITNINWNDVGRLATTVPTKMLDMFLGFLEKVNWGEVGKAIGEFFKGAIGGLTDWFEEKDWEEVGTNLANSLIEFIKNIDPAGVITELWNFIKAVAEGVGGFLSAFVKNLWNGLIDELDDKNLIPDSWKEKLKFDIPVTANLDEASIDGVQQEGQKELDENPLEDLVLVYEHGTFNARAVNEQMEKYLAKNHPTATIEADADDASLSSTQTEINNVANPKNGWWVKLQSAVTGLANIPKTVSKTVEDVKTSNPIKLATSVVGQATAATAVTNLVKSINGNADNKVKVPTSVTGKENAKTAVTNMVNNINGNANNKVKVPVSTTGKDDSKTAVTNMVKSINDNKNNKVKIKTSISTGNLPTSIANVWDSLQKGLNNNPLEFATSIVGTDFVSKLSSQAKKTAIAALKAIGFAEGGSVLNNGSLILAGEAGPEVVANMGNRTGVMNVDQMEAAVANGNIPVVNAIYAVLSAVNSIDPNVYLDSQKIGESVTRYQNNQARRGLPRMV